MSRIMGTDKVTLADGSFSLAVAGVVTIYTKAVRIKPGAFFSASYQFVSAGGAPDVKIEIEQSFQEPATEGAADANWVEPEGMSDIEASLITETMHHKALSLVTLPFMRFKITGNGANPADTIGSMRFTRQEE